jgi:hypothetical protein
MVGDVIFQTRRYSFGIYPSSRLVIHPELNAIELLEGVRRKHSSIESRGALRHFLYGLLLSSVSRIFAAGVASGAHRMSLAP